MVHDIKLYDHTIITNTLFSAWPRWYRSICNKSFTAFTVTKINVRQTCLCTFASSTLSFTRKLDKFSSYNPSTSWDCNPDRNPTAILFL